MNLQRLFAVLLLFVSFTGFSVAAENPYKRLIVKFEQHTNKQGTGKQKTLLRNHLQVLSQSVGRSLSKVRSTGDSAQVLSVDEDLSSEQLEEMLQVINASPLVEYAEIDRWVTPARIPNDPKYSQQWSLSGEFAGGINMPATWDMTTGSADVVVAVIDTGVRSHPDFDSRLLPGYDFISTSSVGNDGNGRDSDASDPGDWSTTSDFCGPASSTWHGTHVAGIIAAETDNSAGIAGINWKSKILPVRTLGRCGGYMSDISDGIRWAAGLSVSGVPANKNPAQVINLSLGAPGGCGITEQNAINAAFNAGVVVVAAAGNAGGDVANSSPAACANVIAVAAVTRGGSKAYYSNVGEEIDIAAPGGGAGSSILSTYNSGREAPDTDNYESMQGTSMAAPHVAGVASLMLSVSPGLKPAEIEAALKRTAKPFPSNTGSDCLTTSCGSGIMDARAAVAEVIGNSPPVITLVEQQRVNPGQQVSLSAVAKDPEGKTMTYQWSQVSGPSVTLANANASSAGFIAPVSSKVLVFQLVVTDADNLRAQVSTSIVINQAPSAEAGNSVAAAAGKKFFLNGSASKDDLAIASYGWKQTLGAKVTLSNSSSMSPSFIAPTEKQNMQFVLTVSDGEGLSNSDNVLINVNSAPVADAGGDIVVNPGELVSLNASGSYDSDGSIKSYSWYVVGGPAVDLVNAANVVSSFVAPSKAGLIVLELAVQDNSGLITTDRMGVYVNAAPEIKITGSLIGNPGDRIQISAAESRDFDGNIVSYSWQRLDGAVSISTKDTHSTEFVLPANGQNVVLRLNVTDNLGLTSTQDIVVQLNQPPVANASVKGVVNPGQKVSLDARLSTDLNDNITTYMWHQLGEEGISLQTSQSAVASFIAPAKSGYYQFELVVEDSLGLSDSNTFDVYVNEAPVVAVTKPALVNVGEWMSMDATGSTDPDGYLSKVAWRQLSGTPVHMIDQFGFMMNFYAPHSAGRLEFEVAVTDDNDLSSSKLVSVQVNGAPQANAGQDLRVRPGEKFILNGNASRDTESNISQYSWQQVYGSTAVISSALSSQASVHASSENTVLRFRLTVRDENGLQGTDEMNVVVSEYDFVSAGASQSVSPSQQVVLVADVGLTNTSLYWEQISGPEVSLLGEDHRVSFSAPAVPAVLTFSVTATDAKGRRAIDVVEVRVSNMKPRYEIPEFISADEYEDIRLEINALDDNGSKPVYELISMPPGARFDEDRGVFEWLGQKPLGEYELIFSVSDADDAAVFSIETVRILVHQPGKVVFSGAELTLMESDGNVMLGAIRQGGSDGIKNLDVRVKYSLADENDIVLLDKKVIWQDGEEGIKTISLSIIDDLEGEGTENLTLELYDAVNDVVTTELNVYLIDDDVNDTGLIDFEHASVVVNEGDGVATLSVKRKGGAHGEVRVLYRTIGAGAESGRDFDDNRGELYWEDGDYSEKTVEIVIHDDDVGENDETVLVELDSFGTANVANKLASVVIKDNDPTCFIATAAYGTGMASEVRYLRAFRDDVLLTNSLGKKFVDTYYRYSPPIADYLRQNATLKEIIRIGLQPLIAFSKLVVSDSAYAQQTADRR